ncbi:hypothetical protein MSAN_01190400 [Mycena sanguinolenta]|uniref:Uncharacterized protein n=1 Tax=Mycena sanguinolenta TaxID=230812 RepID=A0A8H6YPF1_9AGAR|nr:hypothetical protein MSAN_01190400 [Mycena sanguinolenta]
MPPSHSSAVCHAGPTSLLPCIRLPPCTREDRLREKQHHDAEEPQCKAANDPVRAAKVARDAAPDNAILQMKYQQELEDYKENFAPFIEDEALAECIDLCRPEFDKHLRSLYANFTGKNESNVPLTLDLLKFMISLANPFHDRPDEQPCIALYYQHIFHSVLILSYSIE